LILLRLRLRPNAGPMFERSGKEGLIGLLEGVNSCSLPFLLHRIK